MAKRGPGRPPSLKPDRKTLNLLRGLSKIQCTVGEAAAACGCHRKTLHEFMARYPVAREAWESGKEEGKTSLRRLQWSHAKKNPTMAIFLGKQYLDQKDKRELGGPDGGAIPIAVDVTKMTDEQLDKLEKLLTEAYAETE